jgi:transposase
VQKPEAVMGWRQGQAYSQDLRDRVLAAVDDGMPVPEAAPLFRVSVSYIYKAQIRRRRTGETTARPQRCQLTPKLARYHEEIRAAVKERPDATVSELREWLLSRHGVSVSHAVMWTALARLGLTRKKRPSTPASRTVRMSPRPVPSGASNKRP